ncbi:MAG: cytochrome d ubiquinol oxidase subunit II, partial [Bacteroidaceae bacterium]|nr:cytochrome d ubiquinol oxidase subunit II [Bacteroidaceae bacterium]
MTMTFLQQYWWFVVSLLGSLLVFLLFVQGTNSMLFTIGKDEAQRSKLIRATGSKWELTFTTLVTFGGAFFASFPLFYSTSFGGAYWLWMIILFSFVLQPVSYEFEGKLGNIFGKRTFHTFLVINGVVGPLLLGGAVATFFNGSNFLVEKNNLLGVGVISSWANGSHGLDALLDVWNLMLGLAVFFLARILGALYVINNVEDEEIRAASRRTLRLNVPAFLGFFLSFVIRTLFKEGFAVDPASGAIFMEAGKYAHNLLASPCILVSFLLGVVGVLFGIATTLFRVGSFDPNKGIWYAGVGTVLTVLALFLLAGYNDTAFYPSNADLQ